MVLPASVNPAHIPVESHSDYDDVSLESRLSRWNAQLHLHPLCSLLLLLLGHCLRSRVRLRLSCGLLHDLLLLLYQHPLLSSIRRRSPVCRQHRSALAFLHRYPVLLDEALLHSISIHLLVPHYTHSILLGHGLDVPPSQTQ